MGSATRRAASYARPGKGSSAAWRSPWLLAGVVVVLALVVGGFALAGMRPPATAATFQPDPAQVTAAVTGLPQSELDAIGTGGTSSPLRRISGTPAQKPQVVYLGAEYCPYCAAERWSLVQALGRFGSFSGLKLTTSSSTDTFPDTPSFSFHGSTYSSPYLDVVAIESADRQMRPLDAVPSAVSPVLMRYNPRASLPFLYVDGRFVVSGSNLSPVLFRGLSWSDVTAALNDPSSPLTRGVVGNANHLTAGICEVTSGQPASVCSSAAVRSTGQAGQ